MTTSVEAEYFAHSDWVIPCYDLFYSFTGSYFALFKDRVTSSLVVAQKSVAVVLMSTLDGSRFSFKMKIFSLSVKSPIGLLTV